MKSLIIIFFHVFYVYTISAQTRRALVIGLGQQEDKAWGKINGDKDVLYVDKILKDAKFKAGNIRKVVNKQATKKAIVNAFKSLMAQSKRGDVIYVHYSGHGQQMKDVHNDERMDWMNVGFHTMHIVSLVIRIEVRSILRTMRLIIILMLSEIKLGMLAKCLW